ncbi:MAG: hypothetical protein ACXAB4_02825 [Candidatus Hodarchaeales archaeon]
MDALKKDSRLGLYGSPIDDFFAYPVVFLYRHSLELYMKAVILIASPMLKIKKMDEIHRDKLLKTHSLDNLRQKLEQVLKAYEWDWDLNTPHFRTIEDFRRIISELHAVDKGSSAFRYPLDTKGNASLATHFRFNLYEFCEVLDSLFPVLEGAALGAYEVLQQTYEAMAEAREWELDNADYQPYDD